MNYKKIVRASAVYDLLLTAPFMIPYFTENILSIFKNIGNMVGLTRTEMTLNGDILQWISLMATIVTVWSVLRIINPERRFGLYDGFARIGFSFWFIFYPLIYGSSQLSLLFLGPELAWGIVQLWGYKNIK